MNELNKFKIERSKIKKGRKNQELRKEIQVGKKRKCVLPKF